MAKALRSEPGVPEVKNNLSALCPDNGSEICGGLTKIVLVRPLAAVLAVDIVYNKLQSLDGLEPIVDFKTLDKDWVQTVLDKLRHRMRFLGPFAGVAILGEEKDLGVTVGGRVSVGEVPERSKTANTRRQTQGEQGILTGCLCSCAL